MYAKHEGKLVQHLVEHFLRFLDRKHFLCVYQIDVPPIKLRRSEQGRTPSTRHLNHTGTAR